MEISVITLFPEMLHALRVGGVTARALEQGLLHLTAWNPRDFSHNKHRRVDDRPYGGGPGMLMQVQPLRDAIHAAKAQQANSRVIYLSPQGKPLAQAGVEYLLSQAPLILLCGRYEGIDERLLEREVDEEWSIGDYVLSGGELAAMVLIDAMARLVPGVLGHEESARQDSFYQGLLDCPHYTRPEVIDGQSVPEVLLQGHHQHIERWREQQALARTWQRRPDLLENKQLTQQQQALLDALISNNRDSEKTSRGNT